MFLCSLLSFAMKESINKLTFIPKIILSVMWNKLTSSSPNIVYCLTSIVAFHEGWSRIYLFFIICVSVDLPSMKYSPIVNMIPLLLIREPSVTVNSMLGSGSNMPLIYRSGMDEWISCKPIGIFSDFMRRAANIYLILVSRTMLGSLMKNWFTLP